jgi:hypothetical protein
MADCPYENDPALQGLAICIAGETPCACLNRLKNEAIKSKQPKLAFSLGLLGVQGMVGLKNMADVMRKADELIKEVQAKSGNIVLRANTSASTVEIVIAPGAFKAKEESV